MTLGKFFKLDIEKKVRATDGTPEDMARAEIEAYGKFKLEEPTISGKLEKKAVILSFEFESKTVAEDVKRFFGSSKVLLDGSKLLALIKKNGGVGSADTNL